MDLRKRRPSNAARARLTTVESEALHTIHYNFVRIHQTLRCTPAMAAGISETLWELADMVRMLEEWETHQGA
jgi:hypothetical protein